ncbi:MAG: hypothetical protein MHM6MM_009667 [Cercozoa sp. M6MM]
MIRCCLNSPCFVTCCGKDPHPIFNLPAEDYLDSTSRRMMKSFTMGTTAKSPQYGQVRMPEQDYPHTRTKHSLHVFGINSSHYVCRRDSVSFRCIRKLHCPFVLRKTQGRLSGCARLHKNPG